MKTPLFSLGAKDFLHGLLTAIGTAVLTALSIFADSGTFPTDAASLKSVAMAGVAGGIAYVGKVFLSNSKDQFAKSEPEPTLPNK